MTKKIAHSADISSSSWSQAYSDLIEEMAELLWRVETKPELRASVDRLFASKFFHLVDIRVYGSATRTGKTRCVLEVTDRLLRLAAALRANDCDAVAVIEHEIRS